MSYCADCEAKFSVWLTKLSPTLANDPRPSSLTQKQAVVAAEWRQLLEDREEDEAEIECLRAQLTSSEERVRMLREPLDGIMCLIERHEVVRDTSRDDAPGWAMRQLPFVKIILQAEQALAATSPPPE